MPRIIPPMLLTALVAALSPVLFASSDPAVHAGEAFDDHPQVEDWETCDGCHREETPELFQAWFAGKHGLNNVKCFVCHGAVGTEGFAARPGPERCFSCHGEKAESMSAPFMKGKDCFSCHPAHQLTPHFSSK